MFELKFSMIKAPDSFKLFGRGSHLYLVEMALYCRMVPDWEKIDSEFQSSEICLFCLALFQGMNTQEQRTFFCFKKQLKLVIKFTGFSLLYWFLKFELTLLSTISLCLNNF